MTKLSYDVLKATIDSASALEIVGMIHLASRRLQELERIPSNGPAEASTYPSAVTIAAQRVEVGIYLAGSPGLRQRAEAVGKAIYKIGTTTRRSAQDRVDDLSKIRYGGYDTVAGSHRAGFDDYSLIPFKGGARAMPPGLKLRDGCLFVTLPRDLSRGQFECRFRHAIAAHSVLSWAETEEGRTHLLARGKQLTDLPSVTGFAHGIVRAKELYFLPLTKATAVVAEAAAAVCLAA
ncbi:hypothetical protein ACFPOB_18340 [Bosea eneae]|uniref:Uncharacterized protein n=1 Tax=Bosea eneae TaxID=151454 RepID=A0ABW0IV12_9HYPH